MDKQNKTRIVCMNCLHSKIVDKHDEDPENARLIITYSCNNCAEESDEIEFYDYQMRLIEPQNEVDNGK
ncbi:hypothetical protein HZQ92_05505 [Elizabethkingia anophelis]|nr:hypothetical protein [Elizabethkingia anophelis]MCT3823050.1 hypothetical protein [Elizabethkingia anophelis]MCT3930368.1 hypothetical protein [Elizabethkingia anophelis]MCT4111990.1 hypothetical protein [Elizabethkingia anophelis]